MTPQLLLFAAAKCDQGKTFFGLPVWYKYLKTEAVPDTVQGSAGINPCRFVFPDYEHLQSGDFLAIGLGVADILLRLAGLVAFGFIVYGGIRYVISQGEPENIKNAQATIVNSLIGLVITIVASGVVSFLGNRLG